jgi:hypothetical protein
MDIMDKVPNNAMMREPTTPRMCLDYEQNQLQRMMSTEEGLVIDNAVVILHVVRDGDEHKLLSPPYGKHSELVREACWLSTPLLFEELVG